MKLTSFRTFIVFVCSIGLISYVIAGPGASSDHGRSNNSDVSGPGFGPDNNPGVQGRTASDGTKFDAENNPGDQGNQFGKSTAANGSSNGSLHENSNAVGKGEKVIETDSKNLETESAEKGEKTETETDPKFKGSLLDEGLRDSASAKPGESPKGTPPGHHYGWEKGKHNPHREASVSPSPSASASASATASATATPTP